MQSLDMLCSLAFVKKCRTQLTQALWWNSTFSYERWRFCDVKLAPGVSWKHDVGIHRLLGMFTSFKYFLILPEVTFESQSTTLKSFELSRKSQTFKVHNLLHSFQVSNYHLVDICSANNRKKLPVSQSNRLSSDYISCRKMSPIHLTLKAGVK